MHLGDFFLSSQTSHYSLFARLHLTNPLTNSCTVLTEGVKTFGKEAEGSIQSQDLSIIWVVNRFIPLKVAISKSLTI